MTKEFPDVGEHYEIIKDIFFYKKNCKGCSEQFLTPYHHTVYCSYNCRLQKTYPSQKKKRFSILQRDKFRCVYCGRNPSEDGVKLEIDHIIPISKGGTNKEENLATSCRECNRGKSDTTINDKQ